MYKTLIGLGAVVLTLAGAGTAAASTVTDSSSLNVNYTSAFEFVMRNVNRATIDNTASSYATTGGNFINSGDDMENVSIQTGDASAWSEIDTQANTTTVDVTLETAAAPDISSGIDVSDDSSVTVNTHQHVTLDFENENEVDVTNTQSAGADTGNIIVNSGDSLSNLSVRTGNANSLTLLSQSFNNLNLRVQFRQAQ